MYDLEQALVDDFMLSLADLGASPWGNLKTATEFDYLRGRTDVVAITGDGEILAFEAKLTRWRDAMYQASRNTCFAHRSYIVVPEDTANRAARYASEFSQRSVGICTISDGQIIILLDAPWQDPIQAWLSSDAADLLLGGGGDG